jgi:ribonuclease HI
VVTSTIRSLFVYTDAKVRGRLYLDPSTGKPERTKIGESTVACVGWIGAEATEPVVSAAVSLVGRYGPQRAEYEAVILGLANSLAYVAETEAGISHVVVCSDNKVTIDTLTGRKGAQELTPLRTLARELQGWLEHMGVEVHYEYVPRTNERHKQAHQLSQSAKG